MTTRIPTEKQKLAELRRAGKSKRYIDSYMRGWHMAAGTSPKRSARKEAV